MRDALQPYVGQRIQITAPVQRMGTRIGWTGVKLPTILVGPVLDADGAELANHLWLQVGRRIAAVAPQPGDLLTLTGRVKPYTRRRRQYHGTTLSYESDLGLAYPARCAVVTRAPEPEPESEPESADYAAPTIPAPPAPVSTTKAPTGDALTNRARILFALAVLSLDDPEGVTLTNLMARAGVSPIALLDLLKRLALTHVITFTPTGRVQFAAATSTPSTTEVAQ